MYSGERALHQVQYKTGVQYLVSVVVQHQAPYEMEYCTAAGKIQDRSTATGILQEYNIR